jgi:hypothetical protein
MAHHRLDPAAVNRLLRDPRGGVARDFQRRGRRVLAIAKQEVGYSSGDTWRSLRVRALPPPLQPGVEVGSDLLSARFNLTGHGIIRPKRAKALRFKPKGSGRFVFTMRVGLVAANPYLQRALRRGVRG